MADTTTIADIGRLILTGDGPPRTTSLIPISVRAQDGVLSGDTNASFVASTTGADTPPPPELLQVPNNPEATLWYFVQDSTSNDQIQVLPVQPALYSAQVSFPDPENPTGLVLLTLQGDAILNAAGTIFGPEPLDYLFLVVYVHVEGDDPLPDVEGYGILPLRRTGTTG